MKPLGFHAALCQITGDWKAYKEQFRLPQHNENSGCCWSCAVTPAGIRDASSSAPWRTQRLNHWDVINRMLAEGLTLSTLFNVPCFDTKLFRYDWLHVGDQGVAADWLGQMFFFMLPKFPGSTDAIRCNALWREVQAYYQETGCESRLDALVPSMLSPSATAPKLKAKAAEVRALVPCAARLACQHLDSADPLEDAVKACTLHLAECYKCLSHKETFSADLLAQASRRFCLLYVEIHCCSCQAQFPIIKVWGAELSHTCPFASIG